MAIVTTYSDVLKSFKSLPQSKFVINEDLLKQWFYDALGEYELEISEVLFNEISMEFDKRLSRYQIKTIALIMYTYYLTRELSRAEKLSTINTKEITMTGGDESKRITYKDLEFQMKKAQDMLNKQKQNCFN